MDEPAQIASERSRKNTYYERYCFIRVTSNMNAKGQTWKEYMNSDKAQRKIARVSSLVKWDRGWWHKHTKQARALRYKS